MKYSKPTNTVFYAIEHAIKSYRRFAHQKLKEKMSKVTLDQALVLMILENDPMTNQVQLARLLFKDNASITRIIKLMIENGILIKSESAQDGRMSRLLITKEGQKTLEMIKPVVVENRSTAMKNVSEEEISQLIKILTKISNNVTEI